MRVEPYAPTQPHLSFLFEKFNANRNLFSDELPTDPIHFVTWVAAEDACMFAVYADGEEPVGVFIFSGIVPGESCYSHIFIWNRDAMPHRDLVLAAQIAAAAVFKGGLRRITGITPVTHAHARVFAERVGFVVEGRLRKAVSVNGLHTDAWISGLLPEDLIAALPKPEGVVQ